MDFGFTEEQEKRRKEVCDYFMKELPEDYDTGGGGFGSRLTEEENSFMMEFQQKICREKGWLTSGWPKKYGGMGLSAIEAGVITEETARIGYRWPSYGAVNQTAPVILLFGTDEQKERFIPPITRGEQQWMQAFTEPDAGSDEANVQLRAVDMGDHYVLNGQKHFVSGIQKPDYLYTLVRTADTTPVHRGVSLFLIPADTPGITFRPQVTIGFSSQNEIFFDDVKVPKDAVAGQLNRGFYHAMATFEFERAGTHWAAYAKLNLEEIVQFCREEKRNGKPLIEDPEVREMLALRAVQNEVTRLAGWAGAYWSSVREEKGPAPASASSRFYYKEFSDTWGKQVMDMLGLYGQLREGSKHVKKDGQIARLWDGQRSTHGGGTIEVYKIVLANRGLGLPRIPRQFNAQITKALAGEKKEAS